MIRPFNGFRDAVGRSDTGTAGTDEAGRTEFSRRCAAPQETQKRAFSFIRFPQFRQNTCNASFLASVDIDNAGDAFCIDHGLNLPFQNLINTVSRLFQQRAFACFYFCFCLSRQQCRRDSRLIAKSLRNLLQHDWIDYRAQKPDVLCSLFRAVGEGDEIRSDLHSPEADAVLVELDGLFAQQNAEVRDDHLGIFDIIRPHRFTRQIADYGDADMEDWIFCNELRVL